jgi:hypothetical protein
MTIEHEDWENRPPAADSINTALLPAIEHIFAVTADGSPERAAAIGEVLAAVERIKQALVPKPRFH